MPTRPRLSENQRCFAEKTEPRGWRLWPGTVVEVLPKGYMVLLDGGVRPEKFSEQKLQPSTRQPPRAPAPKMDPQHQRPSVVAAARRVVAPVVKPDLPEQCKWWLDFVHTLPCCNCGLHGPIEAHHEGKKGVSQKVRDTLAVPLCIFCHYVYTGKNCLPEPSAVCAMALIVGLERIQLRTREESLRILQAEQERLLTAALQNLAQPARIEVLSKAMARAGGVR